MPPFAVVPKPMVDPYGYANADALRMIINNLGETERQRQDQQIANDILGVIEAGGGAEDIARVIQSRQVEYSEGVPGIIQKLSSGFAGPSQITTGLAARTAERAMDPMAGLKEIFLRSRIDATDALTEARGRSGKNQRQPFQQTPEEKAYDRDIKVLTNDKATEGQKKLARQRIALNPVAQTTFQGGMDYSQLLDETEDLTEEVRANKWYAPKDKVYGTKAYNRMLDTAVIEGTAKGYSAASIEADFNRWWDEQYEKEEGQSYQKFGKRPGYDEKSAQVKTKTAGGIREATEEEIDALIAEFGGNEKMIRQAAKTRGITIPK
jgi:hypothetical protein